MPMSNSSHATILAHSMRALWNALPNSGFRVGDSVSDSENSPLSTARRTAAACTPFLLGSPAETRNGKLAICTCTCK